MKVADLFAVLRIEPDKRSFNQADALIQRVGKRMVQAFGIRGAVRSLIGFNDQMEQARLRTASLLQLGLGGTFNDNLEIASGLMDELQTRASAAGIASSKLRKFMADITLPVTKAGLATKDLAEFTVLATLAAKKFGAEGTAALDVQQALTQKVSIQDRFATGVIEAAGLTREKFNRLNTKSAKLAVLQTGLRSDAIVEFAKKQSKTFAGSFAVLKDEFKNFLGAIGQPVFKAITAEFQKLIKWIGKNREQIRALAESAASLFLTVFNAAKSVVGVFIRLTDLVGGFDNAVKLLVKAWIAFKALKLISFLGALASKLTGVAAATTAAGAVSGIGALGGGAGAAAAAGRGAAATGLLGGIKGGIFRLVGIGIRTLGPLALMVGGITLLGRLFGGLKTAADDEKARGERRLTLAEEFDARLKKFSGDATKAFQSFAHSQQLELAEIGKVRVRDPRADPFVGADKPVSEAEAQRRRERFGIPEKEKLKATTTNVNLDATFNIQGAADPQQTAAVVSERIRALMREAAEQAGQP